MDDPREENYIEPDEPRTINYSYVAPNPFLSADTARDWNVWAELKNAEEELMKKAIHCRYTNCKAPVTHLQVHSWGEFHACTLHALYANKHNFKYKPLAGVVVTDEERVEASKLSYCQNCSMFSKGTGGCKMCEICEKCQASLGHSVCPGCKRHRFSDDGGGNPMCATCHRGNCCTILCETCWEVGQMYCQVCCKARPAALRHPPPPPNRINKGFYVESHDRQVYPARRPETPPYKPFLYLGAEVEVECGDRDRVQVAKRILEDHKYDLLIKHDGSLNNGLECVTGPMSLEEHQKFWPVIVPDLIKAGCRAWKHKPPGLHVHCSRDWFTGLTIGKMLVFLNSPRTKEYNVMLAGRDVWWAGPDAQNTFIDKKLSDGFPPRRWQVRMGRHMNRNTGAIYHRLNREHAWCNLVGNDKEVISYLLQARVRIGGKVLQSIDLQDLVNQGLARHTRTQTYATGRSRYEALNLQNPKTIEFRLFKSTLKVDHILANIEYCHALSNWAQQSSLRDVENWQAFWDWVQQHRRPYPHLRAFFEHPETQHDDNKVEYRMAKEVAS